MDAPRSSKARYVDAYDLMLANRHRLGLEGSSIEERVLIGPRRRNGVGEREINDWTSTLVGGMPHIY